MYEKVDGYDRPRQELTKMGMKRDAEMTEYQTEFLCGLLKKFCPRKIVEVGVARGGTTSIIAKCMQLLEINDYELHSVDINKQFYKDNKKRTGYSFLEACSKGYCSNKNHKFHLGKYLPEVIDSIGNNIDFLILDTVHAVPGELLDILVALPYLSKNAIVLFHDLAYCHQCYYAYKIKVDINMQIFNVLNGKKFLNINRETADPDIKLGYPNIGAVMVNDIDSSIRDLFSSFTILWNYWPDNNQIEIYRKKYGELYGKEVVDYFDWILELQKLTLDGQYNYKRNTINELKTRITNKNIIIFGTGKWGQGIKPFIEQYTNVIGFCVSDNFSTTLKSIDDTKIYRLHELKKINNDFLLIVASSYLEIIEEIEKNDFRYYIPDGYIFEAITLLN